MNYVIDFFVTKAFASIEVEADSKEEAEDIAWHEFENMTVGELKKMEVDMESDTRMKCKVCGGTGTSNTCVNGTFKPCPVCDGTGEYEPFDADVELDKLYPTEQTNEEWFCRLDTRLKAEAIFVFMDSVSKQISGEPITNKEEIIDKVIMRWLKDNYEDE